MRWILVLVLSLWTASAQAQQSDIRDVISQQIQAFDAEDLELAFSYASPSIQGLFDTPQRFGQMVREGYPMVWRSGDLRFLELREIAGGLWQMVLITSSNGDVHLLDYQMVEIEGRWRINAVQILRPPGAAV